MEPESVITDQPIHLIIAVGYIPTFQFWKVLKSVRNFLKQKNYLMM